LLDNPSFPGAASRTGVATRMEKSERVRLWVALAPLLLVAALGIRDFGGAFLEQRKLGEAAFEATKWGKAYGFDPVKMRTVAQSATTLYGITVSPDRPCGCAGGSAVTQARCDTVCPQAGLWSQPYIVVTTSICYKTVLNWPAVSYCSRGDTQCAATGCGPDEILLSSQSVVPQ